MNNELTSSQSAEEQYGSEYDFFQARLAKQGISSYEWWANRFIARLIRRCQDGGHLLEIGCGLGRMLSLLENDFETYGIDVSEFAVRAAYQNAPRSTIVQADAQNLALFAPGSFDVLLAAHVFEHLERPAETLAQCAELLRPGGTLLFLVPNLGCVSKGWKGDDWFGFRDPGHISLLPPAKWLELVRASGLQVSQVFVDGLWDAPYVPLIPTPLQRLLFFMPTAIQFQLGIPFMPLKLGEDLGVIATN